MRELPSGTVTFLFTDIEGSTRLLREFGDAYGEALAEHRRVLRAAFEEHGGVEVDTQGDAFFFVFSSAQRAVAAAAAAQTTLAEGPVLVRMGLHTGMPSRTEEGYFGLDVHLGARVAAAGHGGQVVLTKATRDLIEGDVRDLGEHRVKDFDGPVWIYQLGAGSFPPLKTISNTNLPRPASSFVGREREVSEVASLIRDGARLVTLTGPGGSGKTRLAIEAAAELVADFKNGVFWVGLAPLRDPALVPETIAQTLGAKDALRDHIGERELLLLLDNLEQVVDVAPELARLLQTCLNLTLLVTSRELLRVRGEVEYRVPPLASSDAVELFCQRSGIQPTEKIAELCGRLDDLPLGVELAAARTSVLSPAQILERLSQRLDLLKGVRDAEARQRTLRATIDWSFDLLTPEEQQLFARLGVFAGGCTLEVAEEVAGADLDTLQSLVDKSLVRHAGERFWMLETIREFALECLEGSESRHETRRSHATYFSAGASRWAPLLNEEQQAAAFGWFDVEIDNLRAAGAQFLEESLPDEHVGLTIELNRYLWRRGLEEEGRLWLERSLALPDVDISLRTRLLLETAPGLLDTGDLTRARLVLDEAIDLARQTGSEEHLARATFLLGHVALESGDIAGAEALMRRAADDFRRLGDERGVALAAWGLATARILCGDDLGALDLYTQALAFHRGISDTLGVAWLQAHVAGAALRAGHEREAAAALDEAFSLYEAIGAAPGLGDALIAFGELAGRRRSGLAVSALALCRSLEQRGLEFGDDGRRRLASLSEELGNQLQGAPDTAPEAEPVEAARWARQALAGLGQGDDS